MSRPRSEPVKTSRKRAQVLLWLAVVFFFLGVGVGGAWDRAWHATQPFEDFWSPPHLFIYANVTVAMAIMGYMMLRPGIREWFGASLRLPLVGFLLPASLVFLGSGLATVATAGLLDSFWHAAFGLDETPWSFPHAMLGHGILLAALGFVSCLLALRDGERMPWYMALIFGWLLLGLATRVLGGPVVRDASPEIWQAIGNLPALIEDETAQRKIRIHVEWNLARTNPLFVPLGSVAVGIGLALSRRVTQRGWLFLGIAFFLMLSQVSGGRQTAEFFGLGDDPRHWLPVPFFPPALALLVALKAGLSERWAWAAAGWVFAAVVVALWDFRPLLALLGGPLMVVGAAAGHWIYRVVEQPTRKSLLRLIVILSFALPLVLGMIDLYMRANTP